MSNVPISGLPLTTAVCATALVPIVQDGVTCSTYACLLGGSSVGVTQITAGSGISINPSCGIGNVTICSSVASSPMVAGTGTCSIKGNGSNNIASGNCSFVGGGKNNTASGSYSSVVVGGEGNQATRSYSFVGGGLCNTASAAYGIGFDSTVVVGGECNTITFGRKGFIGGGYGNLVNFSPYSAIVGGSVNTVSSVYDSFIGGGFCNTVSASYSFIGGGKCNLTCGSCDSAIVAGEKNIVSGGFSFIGGGKCSTITGSASAIGSGQCNSISGNYSSIGSGRFNCNFGALSTISGGYCNVNVNTHSTISGGYCNTSCSPCAFIGGGANNIIGLTTSYGSILAGCNNNNANSESHVIGSNITTNRNCTTFVNDLIIASASACFGCGVCFGSNGLLMPSSGGGGAAVMVAGSGTCSILGNGCGNVVSTNYSFAGGGVCNMVNGFGTGYNNVLGGTLNCVTGSASCSTISGGYKNTNCGSTSSIVGGSCNTNFNASDALIGSGTRNKLCFGTQSTILGGCNNIMCANYSTILAGYCNLQNSGCYNFIGNGVCGTSSGFYGFLGNTYKSFGLPNTICNNTLGASILNGQGNTIPNSPFGGCCTCFGTILGGCSNSACESFSLAFGGGNTVGGRYSSAVGCNLMATSNCTFYVNNMCVCGTLSKVSGSFKIPHPDPIKAECGKFLKHSFVESPTAGDNIYRFNVTTLNCSASIELPDYYNLLNDNDQVYVNAKNHLGYGFGVVNEAQTHVDITTNSDGEYNILLIGTRKDKLALDAWNGTEVNDVE